MLAGGFRLAAAAHQAPAPPEGEHLRRRGALAHHPELTAAPARWDLCVGAALLSRPRTRAGGRSGWSDAP